MKVRASHLGGVVESGEEQEPLVLGEGDDVGLERALVRFVDQEVVLQGLAHLGGRGRQERVNTCLLTYVSALASLAQSGDVVAQLVERRP